MNSEIKILAGAAVPVGNPATVYTVPTGKAAVIKTIIRANTDVAARTLKLKAKASGGSAYHIDTIDQSLAANAVDVFAQTLTLGAGDTIEASASDTGVTIQIFGYLFTVTAQ